MRLLLPFLPIVLQAQTLPDPGEAAYPAIERFVEVLEQVRQRHPDTDRLAYDRLVNHALEGMLSSLDPHSSFIHPEMAEWMSEKPDLDTHVASLGLTLGWRDDGAYIANVIPGTAAAEIRPGASLLEIDGVETADAEPTDLLDRLRKRPGETSTLLVRGAAPPRPIEFALVHRAVEDRAVTASRLIPGREPATGYLRLASFTSASPREVEAALDELEDEGMKRLILDLRGNPGGSLEATVRILGFFLPPSTAVVTTRGRDPDQPGQTLTTPERRRRDRDYPLIVLIDRGSASASELTAGALQDLERATVIGETSFGKGSVQDIVPAGGGTALRLTVATYHTPSGSTPHLRGITPDVAVETDAESRELTALSFRRDTLSPQEAARLADWKDPVVESALDQLDRSD